MQTTVINKSIALQMISKCLARHFHLKFSCRASEKSQLAALRKKTGYTFTNCKKALELHNNDLTQVGGIIYMFSRILIFLMY